MVVKITFCDANGDDTQERPTVFLMCPCREHPQECRAFNARFYAFEDEPGDTAAFETDLRDGVAWFQQQKLACCLEAWEAMLQSVERHRPGALMNVT